MNSKYCYNKLEQLMNKGPQVEMFNDMEDPVKMCLLSDVNKSLTGGVLGYRYGPSNENCQLLMAERCANKWDGICELASQNREAIYPNNATIHGDAAANPQNLVGASAVGDQLVHDAAERKYCTYKNCNIQQFPFDPTNFGSPMVTRVQRSQYGCNATCAVINPQTIDSDPLMNKMLDNPDVALDTLSNICTTHELNGVSLDGTRLGQFCKSHKGHMKNYASTLSIIPQNTATLSIIPQTTSAGNQPYLDQIVRVIDDMVMGCDNLKKQGVNFDDSVIGKFCDYVKKHSYQLEPMYNLKFKSNYASGPVHPKLVIQHLEKSINQLKQLCGQLSMNGQINGSSVVYEFCNILQTGDSTLDDNTSSNVLTDNDIINNFNEIMFNINELKTRDIIYPEFNVLYAYLPQYANQLNSLASFNIKNALKKIPYKDIIKGVKIGIRALKKTCSIVRTVGGDGNQYVKTICKIVGAI